MKDKVLKKGCFFFCLVSYLGHKFNVAGEWGEQVEELAYQYSSRLDMIDTYPLPVVMKLEAVRKVVLAKIQHLFANVHIPHKFLGEINNKIVEAVKSVYG